MRDPSPASAPSASRVSGRAPGGADPAGESGQGRVARKRMQRVRLMQETAARIFAEKGFEGANLDEIAARLDLNGSSLYHYFSSKHELFLRCVESTAGEVVDRLSVIADSEGPATDRLRRLFHDQVLIEIRDYPDFVPLFLKVYAPDPAIRERVLQLRQEHGAVFERVAAEAGRAVGRDRDETRLLVHLALGSLAYVQDWYNPHGPWEPDEAAARIASELVAPFLSPAGRR